MSVCVQLETQALAFVEAYAARGEGPIVNPLPAPASHQPRARQWRRLPAAHKPGEKPKPDQSAHRAARGARPRGAHRHAAQVTQRLRSKQMRLAHLPDASMPCDVFTKWCKQAKLDAAIAYLTGAIARALYADGPACAVLGVVAALSALGRLLD